VSKYPVEWPGHVGEVQRFDEQTRVPDLATGAGAHEASKLLLNAPPTLRWLPLEGAKGSKLTLCRDDLLYGVDTNVADQLVLQILYAHVEPQRLHLRRSQVEAQTRALEAALKVADLGGIKEAR